MYDELNDYTISVNYVITKFSRKNLVSKVLFFCHIVKHCCATQRKQLNTFHFGCVLEKFADNDYHAEVFLLLAGSTYKSKRATLLHHPGNHCLELF